MTQRALLVLTLSKDVYWKQFWRNLKTKRNKAKFLKLFAFGFVALLLWFLVALWVSGANLSSIVNLGNFWFQVFLLADFIFSLVCAYIYSNE